MDFTEPLLKRYHQGFRQVTDATCGPASVILAAMALGLNEHPESNWYDPRFATWLPVSTFSERGIALHELCILSEVIYCNELDISYKRAYPENFSLFVQDINGHDQIIITNFIQDDFVKINTPCPEGNPHYSPIAEVTPEGELLIADVDTIIQQPYRVKIASLYKSMAKKNLAFGLPRGWLVLRLRT